MVLNEALNVVAAGTRDPQGEVVRLKDRLDDARVVVALRADEERVVELSAALQDTGLQVGDILRLDARAGVVLEKLPKAEVEELVLEEVPHITYADVGGLGPQIEQIRDAIELPVLYAEHFAAHKLTPPKGVLLYGPPGCGKTLIAKAVANALAQQLAETTGTPSPAYFLNVKGPELLNKYVGETERKLREIFARAKEKASAGAPVVIFFDEMDSLFRTRGSGISSDVESHHRPPVPGRAGRGGGAPERHRHRGEQPAGPDRPGRAPPRPLRREDPDRPAHPGGRPGDLREVLHGRAALAPRRDPRGGHRGRHGRDVRRRRGPPLPGGHLRLRGEGDALLQGLRQRAP